MRLPSKNGAEQLISAINYDFSLSIILIGAGGIIDKKLRGNFSLPFIAAQLACQMQHLSSTFKQRPAQRSLRGAEGDSLQPARPIGACHDTPDMTFSNDPGIPNPNLRHREPGTRISRAVGPHTIEHGNDFDGRRGWMQHAVKPQRCR